MTTETVVMRALKSAFIFMVSLLLMVACATHEDPINRVVREITLCKKAGHSSAHPVLESKFTSLVRAVSRNTAPKGGVILCVTPDQQYPNAESTTLPDDSGIPTTVVWIEHKLLLSLDEEGLRFAVAHEVAHYTTRLGCPTDELRYYTFCEHTVDSAAAKIVGKSAALHGLEQLARSMLQRNAPPIPIASVRERIALLKKRNVD